VVVLNTPLKWSMLKVVSRFRRDESGAVLVEIAFIMVLLVTLLVGSISASVAFGRDNSIQNAAREASRYGATLAGPTDLGWLRSVRDVARSAAAGDLDSTIPGQYICVALVDGTSGIRLIDTGGVEAKADTGCFADGRPEGEVRVQVVTRRDTTIQAVVFNADVTLSADAAARFERSG
jgi:Flp pilus assembly pilin Flp